MLLNSKCCVCGKDHKDTKFDSYIPNRDMEFYGGRVSMIGQSVTCECGRVLKGYLGKNYLDQLELIDLEVIAENSTTIDKIVEDSTEYDIKYEDMTYKELQEVAKTKGIKNVNLKRELLLESIAHV